MFKDQNSLIVFIVAVLLGAIGVGAIFFTKPEPAAVTPPEPVPLADAKLPEAAVSLENALPNAGSGQAGGGAPGGFGPGGFGPGGFGPGGPGAPGGVGPGGAPRKRGPIGATF